MAVCGECDTVTTFCGPALTCELVSGGSVGQCYRFCCADADCGAEGACNTAFGEAALGPANALDAVGLCVQGPETVSSCEEPIIPPASGGSRVGGYGADGGDNPKPG